MGIPYVLTRYCTTPTGSTRNARNCLASSFRNSIDQQPVTSAISFSHTVSSTVPTAEYISGCDICRQGSLRALCASKGSIPFSDACRLTNMRRWFLCGAVNDQPNYHITCSKCPTPTPCPLAVRHDKLITTVMARPIYQHVVRDNIPDTFNSNACEPRGRTSNHILTQPPTLKSITFMDQPRLFHRCPRRRRPIQCVSCSYHFPGCLEESLPSFPRQPYTPVSPLSDTLPFPRPPSLYRPSVSCRVRFRRTGHSQFEQSNMCLHLHPRRTTC